MSNIVTGKKTNKSGLYDKGFRHSKGGILVTVDGVKNIEVEIDEFKLCRSSYNRALQTTKIYEFKNKTNLEILNSIFKDNNCEFKIDEADSSDFIFCRLVVLDTKKRTITGTVKEITDILQSEKGCKITSDSNDSDSHEKGGTIESEEEIKEMINLLKDTLDENKDDADSQKSLDIYEKKLAKITHKKSRVDSGVVDYSQLIIYNTDLSGLVFADKSGGFNNPSIQILFIDESQDNVGSLPHSIILVLREDYNPEYVYIESIIGAVVPEKFIEAINILSKHNISFETYSYEVGDIKEAKINAVKRLSEK